MVGDDLIQGKEIELGDHLFSEKDIIEFAKVNDPLKFHTDIAVAKQSRFKGLICSGSQAFNFFYVNRWVPTFRNSVLAGISVYNWNFLHPIYMNDKVQCINSISLLKKTKSEIEIIVSWFFKFYIGNKRIQELELKILHDKLVLKNEMFQAIENSSKHHNNHL